MIENHILFEMIRITAYPYNSPNDKREILHFKELIKEGKMDETSIIYDDKKLIAFTWIIEKKLIPVNQYTTFSLHTSGFIIGSELNSDELTIDLETLVNVSYCSENQKRKRKDINYVTDMILDCLIPIVKENDLLQFKGDYEINKNLIDALLKEFKKNMIQEIEKENSSSN